ncbi:PE-PGRS family protein PE_PGRS33-like isoform X11 [Corvus moneduloides]|nr:PE-PGRS family protein PE_PGRS33-like isoform X11 [Corvus moneduloides]
MSLDQVDVSGSGGCLWVQVDGPGSGGWPWIRWISLGAGGWPWIRWMALDQVDGPGSGGWLWIRWMSLDQVDGPGSSGYLWVQVDVSGSGGWPWIRWMALDQVDGPGSGGWPWMRWMALDQVDGPGSSGYLWVQVDVSGSGGWPWIRWMALDQVDGPGSSGYLWVQVDVSGSGGWPWVQVDGPGSGGWLWIQWISLGAGGCLWIRWMALDQVDGPGSGGCLWIRWMALDQVDGSGSGGWLWIQWISLGAGGSGGAAPSLVLWLCPGICHLPAPGVPSICHGPMSQPRSRPVLGFQGCFSSSKGHTWKWVRGGGAALAAVGNPAQRDGSDKTQSGAVTREVPKCWDCHLLSPCLGWTSVPLLMGIPHRQHPQCHKRSLSSLCPWSPPRLSLCADESRAHATGAIPELEGILMASGFSGQHEGGDFRICSSPHVPGATRKLLLDPPRGRTSLRALLASAFDVSNPNTRSSLGRV